VVRSDPGVVSLFAELRGHERQAAEELGQWKTGVEEPKPLDASPAAIALTLLLTDEELEKGGGDGEIARGGRPGGSDVASPQPAAPHGEPAQVFPANTAAPDERPRMDGVIGWSRMRAVAGGAAEGRPSLSRFPPLEPGPGPRPPRRGHGRFAGGASGLLRRDYKGKEADRLVTRIDPGVVSPVAELRAHERQAAEELGQWKSRVEERKRPMPTGFESDPPWQAVR
jgi:hypothetical protein